MVAPVEDCDLRTLCQLPSEANDESVRISCCHSKLPLRQPEPALQLLRDPQRILAWQHRCYSTPRAIMNGICNLLQSMTSHGAGIPHAEVDVLVSIHVDETSTVSLNEVHG